MRNRRVQYRQWCPPESPLRVEIAEELLRALRPKPEALETLGVLYGERLDRAIRLISAELRPGLSPLAVSVCRERGEVFLSEFNLEAMEQHHVSLALVIAGNRAGFFVHAADGTMQTVRSHEEFLVRAAPKPPVASKRPGKWNWAAAGWVSLLALPVAALAYFRPAFPQKPLTPVIEVRETGGELLIHWNTGAQAILEIQDGVNHLSVPVFANQSRATYQASSGEVEISLIRLDGRHTGRESTRFLGSTPPPSTRDRLYSEIVHVRARADELRAQSAVNRARIAQLEKAVVRTLDVAEKSPSNDRSLTVAAH